jgi:hypothetical protein
MPLDPDPVPDGSVMVDLAQQAGLVLRGAMLAEVREQTPEEPLYRSHFATCPQADEWRRRK